MKIALLSADDPNDTHAFVARIRVVEPLRAVAATHPLQLRWCRPGEPFPSSDVLVLQRTPFASTEEIERHANRIERAKRGGTRVLWELDDHVFCDHIRELIEESAVDEVDEEAHHVAQAHRALLPLADTFICSTDPLRDALLALSPDADVHVIPVALDFDHPRWDLPPARDPRPPAVGWSGGSRVGRDLELIVPAVAELLARNPDLRFLLAGSLKYAPLFDQLPSNRVELVPWVSYDDYPAQLTRVDVALLPMDDHAYNRCKSPLKVIDYRAAGVPAACSPTPPFTTVRDEVGAFATTAQEWVEGVERLLLVPPRDRETLRHHTRVRHDVRNMVGRWWSVIQGD